MEYQNVTTQKSKNFLLAILLSMVVFCLVVFIDIPIARQVIGFLYLTFVPGFIFLKLLKLDNFNGLETVLFSVGISVAFIMLSGFLLNELSLMIGFMQPLSVLPLMITINGLILIGALIVYIKRENVSVLNFEPITKTPFALVYAFLPILSIIGALYVNVYENNSVLIFTLVSIAILVVVGAFSKKLLPSKFYPFAILMIAIAILFHASLISNYIVPFSSDVPGEYFLFKTTQNNGYWDSYSSAYGRVLSTYNNMLSITILPTVYSNLLNLEGTLLFKLVYPLLFSFVPLGLYQIWQRFISKKYAFLATFLFMAQSTFYTEMFGLNRQIIAELFFVLLVLAILHKTMKPINKTVCFIVFSFALVTSHYAISEIVLILLAFIAASLIVLKHPRKNLTVTMVVLFFVIMFIWYIYTSDAATFSTIVDKASYVYERLGSFLDPASRGQTVLTGLGLAESPSVWNTISRLFAYLTQGLIALGFVALVTKRTRTPFKREYFLFSIAAFLFLIMLVLVPGLANTLNMTRFYHILLFFLAPLCIVGAELFVGLFSNRERQLIVAALVLLVLVPYFMFQTNLVYEVTDSDSWSIPLSSYRMDASRLYAHYGYTDDYSVYGAKWISQNVNLASSKLYADEGSVINVLTMYALVSSSKTTITNGTILGHNSVVYLSTLNVVYDVFPYGNGGWNSSALSFNFSDLNLIYTNGNCEIYQKP